MASSSSMSSHELRFVNNATNEPTDQAGEHWPSDTLSFVSIMQTLSKPGLDRIIFPSKLHIVFKFVALKRL